jgi:hypothetical protein
MTLNENEIEALTQLVDLALRTNGLGALDLAAHFRNRISQHKAEQQRKTDEAASVAEELRRKGATVDKRTAEVRPGDGLDDDEIAKLQPAAE